MNKLHTSEKNLLILLAKLQIKSAKKTYHLLGILRSMQVDYHDTTN
jgi:hypothetical protein